MSDVGKRYRGVVCAGALPIIQRPALPTIPVRINYITHQALVDTGCSQTIVSRELARGYGGKNVMTVDGRIVCDVGEADVRLEVGGKFLTVKCLVMSNIVNSFKVIIGMDVINHVGGLIMKSGKVQLVFTENNMVEVNNVVCVKNGIMTKKLDCEKAAVIVSAKEEENTLHISDQDFEANFDGTKWVVAWKWRGSVPILNNKIGQYKMSVEVEKRFDEELEKWKTEGWLRPCCEPEQGIIPLLAVEQPNKGKVRPVMDFREINAFIESHTGDSDVCSETTRKWRMLDGEPAVLDLRNAYLQLHVREDLQQYQVVKHKGCFYKLTRLGFGLNCAPKIMTSVLAKVLSLDEEINASTDHYIDDIIVDVKMVKLERVIAHLHRYGLHTKPPERIEEACVLGLQLRNVPGDGLCWSRGKKLPDVDMKCMTRRELFSICGKLIGHYPVAGWLRVACSFIKRHSEGVAWEDDVGEKVREWLTDVLCRLRENDPVGGVWKVALENECKIWCDASNLAIGIVVEVAGKTVEDASWMRKKDDGVHINVAELDAVLKGINYAIKWNKKKVRLMTDSATVNSWMRSTLTSSQRIKVSGIAEMLVRRRLGMVSELRDIYGLDITVELVRSEANKSDALTRVPQSWLRKDRPTMPLKILHERHHFGVRRSLFFAKQINPNVTRDQVEDVVKSCRECASVDPAPIKWEKGELNVDQNWKRLAVDVTHYGHDLYMTIVDCGPSRFTLWRRIIRETAQVVVNVFEQIFCERGPPVELLLDNSTTFRSQQMEDFCNRWGVYRGFRCAHRPAGNGIVERIHRTIKRLAARTGKSPMEMTFWYNSAPLDNGTIPATALYSYFWRNPDKPVNDKERLEVENRYSIGDVVFVKPAKAKCTTRWPEGIVTGVNSATNVEIDGMPRHVADCRSVQSKTVVEECDEPLLDDTF